MRAFEVQLNDEKLCLVGIGDYRAGALIAGAHCVGAAARAHLFLHVGGVVGPPDRQVYWVKQQPLGLGDEIRVKVVEKSSVDKPAYRQRIDRAKELRAEKRYVRMMAKRFGWKIQIRTKRSTS